MKQNQQSELQSISPYLLLGLCDEHLLCSYNIWYFRRVWTFGNRKMNSAIWPNLPPQSEGDSKQCSSMCVNNQVIPYFQGSF